MTDVRSKIIIDKTEVLAKNELVTAMHPLAAEAGIEILQRGGNAADAAIAAAFASGVVEPFMSGLGAAAYVMVYDAATDQTLTFDGSVVVPRAAREDMFELLDLDKKGSGAYGWRATKDDAAETGYRSVLVPGAVATYAEVLDRFGTMTLGDVLAPAIRLASEGFVPDWYVFGNCAAALQRLKPFSEITSIFYRPDGTPVPVPVSHDTSIAPDAERLVQTDLARTMRLIAEGGRDVFYSGETGRAIAQHLSAHEGFITEQDMAAYEVRIRKPLVVAYREKRIEMIPENSGGPTVAEMLNILEGFDLVGLGHNTSETLHLIAEAQRLAFADRFAYLGDPEFSPIPLEGLLSKAYAAERRRHIDPDRGPVPQPVGDPWSYEPGGRRPSVAPAGGGDFADQHTTHLSVIDRNRNMVSLTASLGQRFGSGVVVPETGVILNNGMMWFDPEPGKINSIVPGKHALHAGTPALVFDAAGPSMALGAPGGRMVLTSVLQVMLNVLDFGLGMQAAISAPRIHCETGSLWADPRLPAEVIEGLRRIRDDVVLREETRLISSYYGRPNGILIDRVAGLLRGGVEPFKVSTAIGF
jgi:gamma-glutamyltranspeptidase/glutathione hydrolase